MIPRRLLRLPRSLLTSSRPPLRSSRFPALPSRPAYTHTRHYAAKTSADEKVENLQELYATAKDEFEIASEETENKSIYAAEDRAAAQEELAKLKQAFEAAVRESEPGVGEEIRGRVGGRLRELERAVEAMEERAMED